MWELGIKGKNWRMMKKTTECAISAVMLDGEILKYVDILQVVEQGCTLSPTLFKIYSRPDSSSRSSEAGSHGGARYDVGIDVCG